MALITWAQYCSYTNTSLTDSNQTLVTNVLIPTATQGIENYCDKKFSIEQYIEWSQAVDSFGNYQPKYSPVNRLFAVSSPDIAAYVTNTGNELNPVITYTAINIYNPITNTNKDYLFDTYSNLTTLFAAIKLDHPELTFTFNSEYNDIINLASNLLAPDTKTLNTTNQPIFAALNQIEARMVSDGICCAGLGYSYPNNYNAIFNPQFSYQSGVELAPLVCIIYQAGYSTIPTDLQFTTAQIVQDILNQVLGKQSTGLKSESIDQYSYTVMDGFELNALVSTKYATALQRYRRAANFG